jgi:5-(carboxyamino)imidazole ribonucleotide synthase
MTGGRLPIGAAIGILGGGQLGRMTAMEARRLGYRTVVVDPDPQSPGAQVADITLAGSIQDLTVRTRLAELAGVVTYEFENMDGDAVEALEGLVPVHPSSHILRVSQHRVREKTTLEGLGAPVTRFRAVATPEDLEQALDALKLPLVLKTATGGYDGKGQAVVRDAASARRAYAALRPQASALIAEELVDLALELSVICARDRAGRLVTYPPGQNRHRRGILDVTTAPAPVSPEVAAEADAIARRIAEGLHLVGVLAVEMFVGRDGRVLVNEIAPRPHNSGHHTIEACATSQFEQLVRILVGLPLGDTAIARPAAMANLLGDLWADHNPPDFARMLAVPGVRLHLYGKAEARPGRKMGHLTAVADTLDEALIAVQRARGDSP